MVNITKQRLQLQAKNLQELKKIAKELGVRYTTSGKYKKHNRDQLVDKIIFKRKNTLTYTKLLLQTKNLPELKKIAKEELGIIGTTIPGKYTREQLIDEIIFRQSTVEDSSKLTEDITDKVITISISCSCKNAVVRVVEEKPANSKLGSKIFRHNCLEWDPPLSKPLPTKYYQLRNIRKMASNAKIKNYQKFSKRQLCEMLGIEFKIQNRDGHRHTLTNVQTGGVEEFKSTNSMATKLNVNPKQILYKSLSGKPLNVNGVNYIIKNIENLP